jgi:hypothetical protein
VVVGVFFDMEMLSVLLPCNSSLFWFWRHCAILPKFYNGMMPLYDYWRYKARRSKYKTSAQMSKVWIMGIFSLPSYYAHYIKRALVISLCIWLPEKLLHKNVSSIALFAFSILKLNSMVWVRERTIPTERPPLVGEVIANFFFADRGCHMVSVTDPYGRILDFLDRSRYFSIK